MLGTPFVVIWLVGFIADLDIDSWLIKGLMYAGMWIAVQFLSKYVTIVFEKKNYMTFYNDSGFMIWLLLIFQPRDGSRDSTGWWYCATLHAFVSSKLRLCLCRAFFDHSMHSALPLGIYLATKFWMYTTWFYWFWNDILCFLWPRAFAHLRRRVQEFWVTRFRGWNDHDGGLPVKCKRM